MTFTLQPFNADFAATFQRWYHDPRLSHFYRGFVQGASLRDCTRAAELMRGHVLVGIQDGKLVGAASLADTDAVLRIFKFGLFVDPDCQHKGIGKLILDGALKWAFDKMNAHKVFFEIMNCDERILKGAKAAGFIHEGTKRSSVFLDGNFYNEEVFSLLNDEYYERTIV